MLSIFWNTIEEIGQKHISNPSIKQKVRLFNKILFINLIVNVSLIITNLYLELKLQAITNVAASFCCLVSLFLIFKGLHLFGRSFALLGSIFCVTVSAAISSREAMVHLVLIYFVACLFLVYDYKSEKKLIYITLVTIYSCLFFLEVFAFNSFSSETHINILYYFTLSLSIVVFYIVIHFVEEVRSYRDQLEKKNEELLLKSEQLNISKEKAENALQVKSQFLSNMSHEMRTPLNAIVGFTDIILNSDNLEENREYIKNVSFAAENMSRLVNDVLDFSKFESDNFTIKKEIFSLKEVLDDIYKLLKLSCTKKGLYFHKSIPPSFHDYIIGDPLRFKQVLINLLANAIKFTEEGGIKLNLDIIEKTQVKQKLVIQIIDSGIGIDLKDQEVIFEGFKQLEHQNRKHYEGTGLGLSIVKKLVLAMNGTIQVESQINKGTIFTLSIPVKLASPPKEKSPTRETELSPSLAGKKILIVDDNEMNLHLFKKILEDIKLNVTMTSCAENALDLLIDNNFDLLFVDLQMPKMTGVEVYEKYTSSDAYLQNTDMETVIVTSDIFQDSKDKILASGIKYVLNKPIRKNDLFPMLNKIIGAETV